jgi:hypothetical protein
MDIRGTARVTSGFAAATVTLDFVQLGFGGRATVLATVVTDANGAYVVQVHPADTTINLEIRGHTALSPNDVVLLSTILDTTTTQPVVLNLVVPAALAPSPPEFHRLTADLAPHLGGARLGTAVEDATHRDLSLLSAATGWDARVVALAAQADALTEPTGLDAEALYGLLRAGLPADPVALSRRDPASIDAALHQAVQADLISITDQQITAAHTAFVAFSASTRRTMIGPGALSSYGDLLAMTGLSASDQATFDALLCAHPNDDQELWNAVRQAGLPADRLTTIARLGYLTRNSAPLMTALAAQVSSPDQLGTFLVGQRLYLASEWTTRVTALAAGGQTLDALIPSAYTGGTPQERLAAYAAAMATKVRITYPTPVITDMVRNDQLILGPDHVTVKTDVCTVLDRASAPALGFGLGRTPVNRFLHQNASAVFAGMTDDRITTTTAHVKTLARLAQISPSTDSLNTLLSLGYTSSQAVAAVPQETFLARNGAKFPSAAEAEQVYRRAQQVKTVTYAFYGAVTQLQSATPPPVIAQPPAAVQASTDKLIEQFPTMATLFGSLEYDECDDCGSILSPAAYLVDILKFLDPDDVNWTGAMSAWSGGHYPYPSQQAWQQAGSPAPLTPYQALTARRPDLPELPLTCENTNTVLPYIDLVNEILEFYVAHHGLTEQAAYDTGDAQTADLIAEPARILPAAYDTLRTARYPIGLPFDLWLETVRRFASYFGTPLWQILDALRPTDDLYPTAPAVYGAAAVALERLGLGAPDLAILTAPDATADWPTLYGFAPNTPPGQAITTLKGAPALAERLGVDYTELIALVRTGFVNPHLDTLVELRLLGIAVEDVLRYQNAPGYPPFTAADLAAFKAALGPDHLAWLDAAWSAGRFAKILVLADPDLDSGFTNTTLQYADGTPADAMVFIAMTYLVRLWRRLPWNLDELDRALVVFLPATPDPHTGTTLGPAMASALLGLAHLDHLATLLPNRLGGRIGLLPLWSAIDDVRYRALFLTGTQQTRDAVLDDPLGHYLSRLTGGAYAPFTWNGTAENVATGNVPLAGHLAAVQAGLQLTASDIDTILADAGTSTAAAPLTLDVLSRLYRYALLASLLKLPVPDMIALKALTGLDPFVPIPAGPITTTALDHPGRSTIGFVELAATTRQAGFSVTELAYLIRNEYDPVGPYRAAATPPLALIRSLATQITRIRVDHAIPADPLTFTDDVIRQEFAQAFPPDVAAIFMAMWTGTIEYRVTQANVADADQLTAAAVAAVPAISVAYDPVAQQQTLVYHGVLTTAARTAVDAALVSPPAYVAGLLDAIGQQAGDFFTRYLAKGVVVGVGNVGFLDQGDFDLLFAAPPVAQDADRARRAKLAATFLPYLCDQLITAAVIASVAADLGADPTTIGPLLTDTTLLDDPDADGRTLLAGYVQAADGGTTITALSPQGTRVDGYLEVPADGGYRFSVRPTGAGTAVLLTFDHLVDPLLQATSDVNDPEPSGYTTLTAGIPYGFTLDTSTTDATFYIRGEALPKTTVDTLVTYPRDVVNHIHRLHLLVAKVRRIAVVLGLADVELHYLLRHEDDFGGLDLGALATQPADDQPARAQSLFAQVQRLIAYTNLRTAMAAQPGDLVDLFGRARRTFAVGTDPAIATATVTTDLTSRIARLTRRDPATVTSAAGLLNLSATAVAGVDGVSVTAAGYVSEIGVGRLMTVLALASRIGVAPDALGRWAVPDPAFPVARDIRDTVKARFTPDQWRAVAQPIFDDLRRMQRDALVAYIMQLDGYADVDQLFEHFLVDPGTQPVVQTSRLRLAISSVQLFIQRCLLNLEPAVHPSVLSADEWQWMKRYRVWQANREIFLWPENWLEPEFRDDKTFLYDALESALAQSSITTDDAETALQAYLLGLEGIARLDITSVYVQTFEGSSGSNVVHVLGRTSSAPLKYYYRSFSAQMWTPWVPVSAPITGDKATIVVWRDRVHVFWADFRQQGSTASTSVHDPDQHGTAADVPLANIFSLAPVNPIAARLSWTSFLNGSWSKPATTSYVSLNANDLGATIDTDAIVAGATVDDEGAVLISLTNAAPDGSGYQFRLPTPIATPDPPASADSFVSVYSGTLPTSSSNVVNIPGQPPFSQSIIDHYSQPGFAVTAQTSATIQGTKEIATTTAHETILAKGDGWHLVEHEDPDGLNGFPPEVAKLVPPFFFIDGVNTFFVEPTVSQTTVDQGNGFLVSTPPVSSDAAHVSAAPYIAMSPQAAGPSRMTPPVSAGALFSIDTSTDWATRPGAVVAFRGTAIGAGGAVQAKEQL